MCAPPQTPKVRRASLLFCFEFMTDAMTEGAIGFCKNYQIDKSKLNAQTINRYKHIIDSRNVAKQQNGYFHSRRKQIAVPI